MKKIYPLLILVTLLFGLAGKAQTYSQGDIMLVQQPTMVHDSTICASTCNLMYMITVQNSFMGDSIAIVDVNSSTLVYSEGNASGQNPWNIFVPVPVMNPVITDDQLNGGTASFFGPMLKVVCGQDTIYNITNFFSLYVPDPCSYGNVSGQVYIDNNNDCSFNSGDVALSPIPVASQSNLSSPAIPVTGAMAYSDPNGYYDMRVQESWMTSYSVFIPSDLQFIFPASACSPVSYSFTSVPQANVDFALQCTGSVDVQCYAASSGVVRPNTPFMMSPYVSNTGCDPTSGQLTFIKDSRVIYNAGLSTNPAAMVMGDTLIWTYTNLTNMSNGAYWNSFLSGLHLTPDNTVNIGDTLCFRVMATVPATDMNPANNDFTICLAVVNSYDPNNKEVTPKGAGATGDIAPSIELLTYTVHFQNTGTAPAYNVSIIDTLDGDLLPASLQLAGTSHMVSPEWLAPGVVKFNYYNINLPDSNSNEAASHGYIRFTVRLKPSLPLGTTINNTARIYFDANTPIVTNTTLNTIANPSGISQQTGISNDIRIYPNPVSDKIYIESLQPGGLRNGKMELFNMSGQRLMVKDISPDKNVADISALPQASYLLKVTSNQGTVTRMLSKQ